MSLQWLVPAALLGLVALMVPVLVHLLTRQERRAVAFPSLRFLVATQLVSMRHRRIHDWWLLVVRAAVLAAAVAALAGPLLITAGRERSWNMRTARAIVVLPAPGVEPVAGSGDGAKTLPPTDEITTAFSSRVVMSHERIADAIRTSVAWLSTQPPAARELLIVGDLRADTISAADLAAVPPFVGIRFLPDPLVPASAETVLAVQVRSNGLAAIETRRIRLNVQDTVVERGSGAGAGAVTATSLQLLEVRAAGDDQRLADAALTALLTEGMIVGGREARRVVVSWSDRTPPPATAVAAAATPASAPWMVRTLERAGFAGAVEGDALIVQAPGRPEGAAAVRLLRSVAAAAFENPDLPAEPRRVPAEELARWSRPAGMSPADAVRQDEGDRRLLWALALVLLAVEAAVRRSRAAAVNSVQPAEVARVA